MLAVTAMKHFLEGTGKEVGVLGKEHDWLRGGNTKESRDIGKYTSSLVSPLSLLILWHTCFQGYGQPRSFFSILLDPLPTGAPEERDAGSSLFPNHLPEPESLTCHSLYQGALGLTGKRCGSP